MTNQEFEREIGHIKFSLAGARDRAEAAEARLREVEQLQSETAYQANVLGARLADMEQRAKTAEARAAQLEAERDEARRKLEQAQKLAKRGYEIVSFFKSLAVLDDMDHFITAYQIVNGDEAQE